MGPQALEHEAIKSAFSELWEPRFCYNRLAGKNSKYGCKPLISLNLELDCDSCCRGFEPHQPPQNSFINQRLTVIYVYQKDKRFEKTSSIVANLVA